MKGNDFSDNDLEVSNSSVETGSASSVFKNIPRKQKIEVYVLAIAAIAIVVAWGWQYNNRLTSPFASSGNKVDPSNLASTTTIDLTADTDHDGLTDYDEINIYHSSPYLEDTDSDGILDGVEVKNSTDPKCPTGNVCNGVDNITPAASSTTAATGNSLGSSVAPTLSIPTDLASSSQQTLQNALDGKADATTLRQLLISSGADKAMLDQISDADLMKSYQQTLQNQQ